ncbi:undecaprenyl-diphosphate phosphatase [Alkalihalobacillus sp. MEB130]|uniref:undecaprenyl-diphosphate phosphatase n=1 Tax=Alkalihalobacillus sp. MEB130 TaxID=2976704 RepID=UPI0028DFD4AB|nr:undecaprenyl-diphosphate phosphatase [Alkalihalobacillus sp. MEB130]MDT8861741.1 undecaprenyl-diphosphate phosphatase [Alkalihalobacillus sp. MEB130]
MNWWEALIIGFIQGISEFLPISSTALMLIVQRLLDIPIGENFKLAFETFLHIASVLAVIVYFRQEATKILYDFCSYLVKKEDRARTNYRFVLLLIISTFITILVGNFIEGVLGDQMTTPATVGVSLIITGLSLILIEHGLKVGSRGLSKLNWKDGIIIGIGQALSLVPGISRTGSTLFTALCLGLNKETALRYSFFLSIPVFLGMTILKTPELIRSYTEISLPSLVIAFLSSFLFALIGIKWFIVMLQNTRLTYFAFYCIGLGIITWSYI